MERGGKVVSATKRRARTKYPLLDGGNRDLPILVSCWPWRRPIKVSGDVPIRLRKLAWLVRRHPAKAAKFGAHLIWPDGTLNTVRGWENRYRNLEIVS